MTHSPAAHRLLTKKARAVRKRRQVEGWFSRGGHVKPNPLLGVVEGRCLTCYGGYGTHMIGGGYPDLPHDTVLEIQPESMSDVRERLRKVAEQQKRMKGTRI
jgi:hypothetical protein